VVKLLNQRIVAELAARVVVNSDHEERAVVTKLKYQFITFFIILSSVLGIFRYLEYQLRYRYQYLLF